MKRGQSMQPYSVVDCRTDAASRYGGEATKAADGTTGAEDEDGHSEDEDDGSTGIDGTDATEY